jgi:hypothetical protein
MIQCLLVGVVLLLSSIAVIVVAIGIVIGIAPCVSQEHHDVPFDSPCVDQCMYSWSMWTSVRPASSASVHPFRPGDAIHRHNRWLVMC